MVLLEENVTLNDDSAPNYIYICSIPVACSPCALRIARLLKADSKYSDKIVWMHRLILGQSS